MEIDLDVNTVIEIEVSDVFVNQNPRCKLWKSCVLKEVTFDEVCRQLNYDFKELLRKGFNANFLTRDRWLDISVLVEKLRLSLRDLFVLVGVTSHQFVSWELTTDEREALDNAPQYLQYS